MNAAYSVPTASDPHAMVDGPRVTLEGALERANGSISIARTGSSLRLHRRFRPILLLRGSNDVLFFLDQGRIPLVGTKDFSYTLNRN